jgi:MerR family transcriptional regulator, light-induced transcriptional regulator
VRVPSVDEAAATDRDLLTLQEAADQLKVHYMTAYRWVRSGELPAFKAGGRLRVRAADLADFVERRTVEVALPSGQEGRTDWPVHADRLHGLLREGRGPEAGALVRKVVADGAAVGDVYLNLLTPALHRIGEDWEGGGISVAEEHRATEIVKALIARMGEAFRRRGPSRGTVATATPSGEQHALGSAMTADFLRGAGYEVHHLGADVPVEDLELFLDVVPCDAVCLSVTRLDLDRDVMVASCRAARKAGAVVLLGGQGADDLLAAEAGAVLVSELGDVADRLADALHDAADSS